jgi:uncharacterized protein YbaA (DUF1428 family)
VAKYGALEYIECVADDVKPGKYTSFPQSVKLKPGEMVVFSYIVTNRAPGRIIQGDEGPRNASGPEVAFDGKRMFWGGFKLLVSA